MASRRRHCMGGHPTDGAFRAFTRDNKAACNSCHVQLRTIGRPLAPAAQVPPEWYRPGAAASALNATADGNTSAAPAPPAALQPGAAFVRPGAAPVLALYTGRCAAGVARGGSARASWPLDRYSGSRVWWMRAPDVLLHQPSPSRQPAPPACCVQAGPSPPLPMPPCPTLLCSVGWQQQQQQEQTCAHAPVSVCAQPLGAAATGNGSGAGGTGGWPASALMAGTVPPDVGIGARVLQVRYSTALPGRPCLCMAEVTHTGRCPTSGGGLALLALFASCVPRSGLVMTECRAVLACITCRYTRPCKALHPPTTMLLM